MANISNSTDRFNGVLASLAVKVRCVVVATSNVATLLGAQTIEGVAVTTGDRVLLTAQTDPIENGIYDVCDPTAWQRAADWDGNRDVELGSTIWAGRLGTSDALYQVTAPAGTIRPGTTAVTITLLFDPSAPVASDLQAVTDVGAITTNAIQLDGGSLLITEQTTVPVAFAATIGQVWVRDDAPNVLMFTDDTDVDHELSSLAGVLPVGTVVNSMLVWSDPDWTENTRISSNLGQLTLYADAGLTEFTQFGQSGVTALVDFDALVTSWRIGSSSAAFNQLTLGDAAAGASLELGELSVVPGVLAGLGQFWVRDDGPNTPMFTDDASTDSQLARTAIAETITAGWTFSSAGVQTFEDDVWVRTSNSVFLFDSINTSFVEINNQTSALIFDPSGGTVKVLLLDLSLALGELSAAPADVVAQGQFWVRDDAPNTPMFTDDDGTDFVLLPLAAGSVTGSGLIWDGAAWVEGQGLTTEVLSFDWATGNDADILITSEEDKAVLTLHSDSLGTGISQTRNPRIQFLRDTGGTQNTANIGIASTVNDDDAAGVAMIDSTAGALAIHSATTGSRVQIGAAGRAKFSVGVNDVKFQYGTDPTTRYSQWQFTGAAGEELHITHANMEDWKIQDLTGSIFMDNSLKLQDQSAADGSDAGYGQIWVRDDAPDTLMFTDDDGTDFVIGGELLPPSFAIDHYDYDYDIATGQADPGPGLFRLNNTTPSSATFMYIDLIDANGVDLDLDVLATIAIGWTLRLVDPTDFATLVRYSITQAVDFTTYWRISIDNIDGGATSLTDTNAIKVIFDPTPNVELGSETSSQSDILYWEGSTGKWEASGSFLTVNPAIPSIGGHIHLGGQGTVDATRCGIFQEVGNSTSTLWFSEGSSTNEGFFCQHIGNAGVEKMVWGWDTPGGGQINIFSINEAGDFAIEGGSHLDVWADINTGTPPTTEAVTAQIRFLDLAGNDVLARIGYEGDNDLKFRNFMHGGTVTFLAEDAAGSSRTWLQYDPAGEFLLAADANLRLQVNISEDAILATANAGVGLYFNDVVKLTTTVTGIVLPQVDTVATPSLSFGDGDTGFYEPADDTLRVGVAGVAQFDWVAAGTSRFSAINGATLMNEAPSATNPVLVPLSTDLDTGIGHNSPDQLSIIAGGLEFLRLVETGTSTTDQIIIGPAGVLGAPATPSLAFGDGDSGWFEPADDSVRLSIAGTVLFAADFQAAGALETFGGVFVPITSSATEPGVTFRSDTNTGIGRGAADALSLIAGGVEALRLSEVSSAVIQAPQSNVGLTAAAAGGQGDGVITSTYNVYSTVGTAGDAATLPATFIVGTLIYVKNDDSTDSMDVFPASGDDAGAGSDTAVAVLAGDFAVFIATAADATWTKLMGGTA